MYVPPPESVLSKYTWYLEVHLTLFITFRSPKTVSLVIANGHFDFPTGVSVGTYALANLRYLQMISKNLHYSLSTSASWKQQQILHEQFSPLKCLFWWVWIIQELKGSFGTWGGEGGGGTQQTKFKVWLTQMDYAPWIQLNLMHLVITCGSTCVQHESTHSHTVGHLETSSFTNVRATNQGWF